MPTRNAPIVIRKVAVDKPASGKLVPIFSPEATGRDLAMAYYKALLEGDRSLESEAFSQLHQRQQAIENDKAALDALGNLSAERGDFQTAERSFRRVLQLDSRDLTALSNLGTLLAKQGRLKEAIPLLHEAFERNEDIPGLAMNLARVECMEGDALAARNTIETALIYCSNARSVRALLAQLSSCPSTAVR